MLSPTAISRALGVLGVIGFMALATTSSIARPGRVQEPGSLEPIAAPEVKADLPAPSADAPPAPREPEPLKELPPAPEEPTLDATPAASPAAISPIDEPANPLPPARQLEKPPTAAPAAVDLAPPLRRSTPVAPSNPEVEPIPTDDPDARARSFVERNRREADEQLKSLREEAAQLKTRLNRVEAGIRRWEALADALDRSQDRPASGRPAVEGASRPRERGVQYVLPGGAPGVIIQSQPVTRADFVPGPVPR